MEIAYVLHHVRSDDEHAEDPKLIGVYSSPSRAEAAAKRLRQAPGFCDHPDGFTIDPYPVDEDHWREGFGSYRPIADIRLSANKAYAGCITPNASKNSIASVSERGRVY